MSQHTTLIRATLSAVTAALLLAAGAAHAAPQEVVKLPRVVITGKSAATVAMVNHLPRVVVTGVSLQTQLKRQTLVETFAGAAQQTNNKLIASAL